MLPDSPKLETPMPSAPRLTALNGEMKRLRVLHATSLVTTSAWAPRATHPLLSPLPPGDHGLQLLTDNPAWLSQVRPVIRSLPVTYRVHLARCADLPLAARLQRGVTDYGEFLAAADARILPPPSPQGWLQVTINHGKATSVRRLLSAFSLHALEVVRTQVGPVSLGNLGANECRDLSPEELAALSGRLPA